MYKWIILLVLITTTSHSYAQSNFEIYNMTSQNTQGSVRSMGLGGASASLGGDFTGVVKYPATLGVYRTSQGGLTMALDFDKTNAKLPNENYTDGRTWFSINQIYYVGSNANGQDKKNTSSWSWGIGMNRVANFNRKIDYSRTNTNDSYIDLVAEDYNYYGDGKAWYAWDVALTDTTTSGDMVTSFQQDGNPLKQRQVVRYSGSLNEVNISGAYNHENKVMLGAGLGIPTGAMKRIQTYTETDESGQITNFNFLKYYEESRTTIVGINAKLGILYQPVPKVRLAAFYQSPTAYALDDTFYYNFTSDVEGYSGLPPFFQSSDFVGQNTYSLRGASNFGISATYLMGMRGLVTFDYIRQNPDRTQIRLDDAYDDIERSINNSLKNTFQGTNTFKAGVELRAKRLYVRGGFNYTSAPYSSLSEYAGEQLGFAIGFGFRTQHMAYDIVYSRQSIKFRDEPYASTYANSTAFITDNVSRIGFSIGGR